MATLAFEHTYTCASQDEYDLLLAKLASLGEPLPEPYLGYSADAGALRVVVTGERSIDGLTEWA